MSKVFIAGGAGLLGSNITGTQNICNSVSKLGLKKMVHVGTANTFGFGTSENPGNEEKPLTSAGYGLDYIDSKHEVHHWILDQIQEIQLPATIVNPTFMLGPHDSKPSSGEMVRNFYLGNIPGFTPRTFPALVNIAYDEQFFSSAKAVRDIDLHQTPIIQDIEESFNWLKDNNYLSK